MKDCANEPLIIGKKTTKLYEIYQSTGQLGLAQLKLS